MRNRTSAGRNRLVRLLVGLLLVLAGGAAGWFWQANRSGADPASRLVAADRKAIEQVVHDYILAHPEILPEAMDNLQKRETARQLAGIRNDVERPFPGAVLGNAQGKVTLVEFSDYACTFCRQTVPEVEALIAANPDIRVVIREFPILSPASADAARMALAAAEQGRYAAFHRAMFAAGRPDPATIEAAARAAGLDMDRARKVMAEPRVKAELEQNLGFARQLGFNGTPSWVVGDQAFSGAVGAEQLGKAISAARD